MDVLSAAMEAAAAADAASSSASSSAASSPRPSSPANSTSTKDGTVGGCGDSTSGKAGAEMHEARVMVVATAAASLEGGGAAVPAVSQAIRDAHAVLEAQAEDIRNGNHPKLLAEKDMQERLKCRRLNAAQETRQLLMNNVEELRAAEIRDSDVQTKVHLERTQEELLDDVHQRIRKAKVDGGMATAKKAVRGIAPTSAAGGTEADKQAATGLLIGKKRARLLPTRSFEKVTPEAVLAKAEAKRIRTVTLSDIEMRTDFQAIISDWRERATKYLSTYNNSHWTKVNVSPDSFRVRGVTFSKGDPVVVTSRVTGEEFHGEITVVKPKAVFLSLYGGVKTRIFVDHISTGRLTVARADAKSVQ